jgi:hypothetical protein
MKAINYSFLSYFNIVNTLLYIPYLVELMAMQKNMQYHKNIFKTIASSKQD